MKNLLLGMVAVGALTLTGCALDAAETGEGTEAQETSGDALDAAPAASQHCVQNAESGETSCYSSFSDALAAATDGQILIDEKDPAAAIADDELAAKIDALATSISPSSLVLGIIYQHSGYGGDSYIYTGSSECTGTTDDEDYVYPNMAAGWNDRVSSFRAYSNCWIKIFEHSNYGGASVGYQGSTSYVGDALNDRCSSIKFS